MREAYYFEFELQNHNLLVANAFQDIKLVNQLLPLHYRIKYFLNKYNKVYEEEEVECNERLIVKKLLFLLIALATGDGISDYS